MLNSTSNSIQNKTRARVMWLLRLCVGAALIGVLWKWQGAGARAALEKISPAILIIFAFSYLVTQVWSATKWQLLLNAGLRAREIKSDNNSFCQPLQLSFIECARLYLIGMFWNLWMPTSVGGDAMRAYLAGRRCGEYSLAATSIFIERLTGFLALLFIGALGLGWKIWDASRAPDGENARVLAPALSTLAFGVFFALAFFLILFAARRSARRSTPTSEKFDETAPQNFRQKFLRAWHKVQNAFELYLQPQTRGALIGALLMSFIFQSVMVLLNFLLARAVGLPLSFGELAWIVPSLSIAALLPLGVGGLGVREAAAIGLVHAALPQQASGTVIAWSLCWQATLWLSALPGGVLHFLKSEKKYDGEIDDEKTV